MSPEILSVSEYVSLSLSSGYLLVQNINLETAKSYKFSYRISSNGAILVQVGSDYYQVVSTDGTFTDTFTHSGASGSVSVSFSPMVGTTEASVDVVSVKEIEVAGSDPVAETKYFLEGNLDDGEVIHFRADTRTFSVQKSPEMYSAPVAILTEVERGSLMKAFVSINERPFYALEGSVKKGVSTIKVHAQYVDKQPPEIARTAQISFRDSSPQLCRIVQAALITQPTTMDEAP